MRRIKVYKVLCVLKDNRKALYKNLDCCYFISIQCHRPLPGIAALTDGWTLLSLSLALSVKGS